MAKELSPEEQIKQLTEQLAMSQARVSELETEKKQRTELEPLIKAKIEAGLTREQAETAVAQQLEHDAYLAKKEAEEKAAKDKGAKEKGAKK